MSVAIITAAFFSGRTNASNLGIPPIAAFCIFWTLLIWLAMMEGGQGCLVGLSPVDVSRCADTHPTAFKSLSLMKNDNNLEKFIVGRQFVVVVVIFFINLLGTASPGVAVLALPSSIDSIFLKSGVALILTTITVGQLTSQVNAAKSMLDFINNYLMLLTTYAALLVEFSGLLHVVYLARMIFSKITGKPTGLNERSWGPMQVCFFWIRVLLSCTVLLYSFIVIIAALLKNQTTTWDGLPQAVSIVLLFTVMAFVGMMEGIQIAVFAVLKLPEEEFAHNSIARKNRQLVFSGENLQAFLIGRQICTSIGMFVIARITTLNITEVEGENIFGVSDGLKVLFNTGLLGAFVFTVVASLIWRLIASSFPVSFLSSRLVNLFIRLCLLLEATGICSSSWVLARYSRLIPKYQPDEVYLEGADKFAASPVNRREKTIDKTVTLVKCTFSFALLILSVTILMAIMASGTTKFSVSVSIILFWCLIIWLAVLEGGQGCLVGLKPVDKSKYSQSHPITFKATKLAHKDGNMERFIVGRQFLVVLILFIISMCGSAQSSTPGLLNLPDGIISVFVSSGLALILTTIILGQLTSQLNGAVSMLDFSNNYILLFSTYLSLLIEFSGLLHSVYFAEILLSGNSGEASKGTRKTKFFFWLRVLLSCALLGFSLAVTVNALLNGQTTAWEGIPQAASVLLAFLLTSFVGIMEGLQIALFAAVNMPDEVLKKNPSAYRNCKLVFKGNNLGSFLIGRQIFAATGMFVVAKIISLDVKIGAGENIFQVSDNFQAFINTGLLGALVTTIMASLIWRVIASQYPLEFLSDNLVTVLIYLCLLLESTGICSASWILAFAQKKVSNYKVDEYYLGSKHDANEAEVDPETV